MATPATTIATPYLTRLTRRTERELDNKNKAAKRIWKWYKCRQWNHRDCLRHVINRVCFCSQEPYDKNRYPGPYLYSCGRTTDVYEFEPGILCDYIMRSNNPENPFSRRPFNLCGVTRATELVGTAQTTATQAIEFAVLGTNFANRTTACRSRRR